MAILPDFSQRVLRECSTYGNIFYFYRDIINQPKVRGNKLSFYRSQDTVRYYADICCGFTYTHEICSFLQQIQLRIRILTAANINRKRERKGSI